MSSKAARHRRGPAQPPGDAGAGPAGGGAPAEARAPGARGGRRQLAAASFGLLFAVAVALVVLRLGEKFGPAEASATARTYRIVSTSAVEMSVQVSRDRNRDALCLLRSRDEFGVEVGHLDLRVPADPDGAAQVITSGTVPTIARGVTGETGRCVALDPGAPAPFEDHAPQALIDR